MPRRGWYMERLKLNDQCSRRGGVLGRGGWRTVYGPANFRTKGSIERSVWSQKSRGTSSVCRAT